MHIFNYCLDNKFKGTLIYQDKSKSGLLVEGISVSKKFKHEPGKHVVQRFPKTEKNGRRHTSTVTVAVTKLTDFKVVLKESDIVTKTQNGGGPGGQHQNKTESAVRMTHTPTNISVYINGRKQNSNKKEARIVLEKRVKDYYTRIEDNKNSAKKKSQVGFGGRGDKVRTYNFIDSRVVDHKLKTKTSKIKQVMRGRFDLLFK
tara:strand:- start:364 stop:969 length:606 start_codon:yes stop_codon:yes gene_type:complete